MTQSERRFEITMFETAVYRKTYTTAELEELGISAEQVLAKDFLDSPDDWLLDDILSHLDLIGERTWSLREVTEP